MMASRLRTLAHAALLFGGVQVIVLGLAKLTLDPGFFAQHHGPFVVFGLIFAVLLRLGLSVLRAIFGGAVVGLKQRRKLGQSGAVYAEIAITALPFFASVFGTWHLAQLSVAKILVSYAAFSAVRTAVVVLPQNMKKKPPTVVGGILDIESGLLAGIKAGLTKVGGVASTNAPGITNLFSGDETSGAVDTILAGDEPAFVIGAGSNTLADFRTSQKAALMRRAATLAVMPVAPIVTDLIAGLFSGGGDYWKGWGEQMPAKIRKIVIQRLVDALGQLSADAVLILDGLLKDSVNWVGKNDPAVVRQKVAAALAGTPLAGSAATVAGFVSQYVGLSAANGGTASGTKQASDQVRGPLLDLILGKVEALRPQLSTETTGPDNADISGESYSYDSLAGAFSGHNVPALFSALLKWPSAYMTTVVTIHDGTKPYPAPMVTGVDAPRTITARVTFLFNCKVPVARLLGCHAYYELSEDTVNTMSAGALGYLSVLGLPGRWVAITAEHTMPIIGGYPCKKGLEPHFTYCDTDDDVTKAKNAEDNKPDNGAIELQPMGGGTP
jgi:hypothetical protein